MRADKAIILGLCLLWQTNVLATVTINIAAGNLRDANGQLFPLNGMVLLVANTNGTPSFGGPTPVSFVSGGNVEVARWNLNGFGTPGLLLDTTGPLTLSGNLAAGNALALYWFPTLTTNALTPGGGVAYGYYRDPVANGVYGSGQGGSDPWFLPADGATVSLGMVTTDAEGTISSNTSVASYTVDTLPTANPDIYTRTTGVALKIRIADLLTNAVDANGDTVTLVGINLTTTNNVTLTTNATEIYYPASAPNVNDQFTYTMSDGHPGGLATGSVLIQMVSATGTNSLVSLKVGVPGAGTNTLTFAGIPNYQYVLQFATNLTTSPWFSLGTNTAGASGLWTITDPTATNAQRYYRLRTP